MHKIHKLKITKMGISEFQKHIENELSVLDRKAIVVFAWHCAVYALPFLGVKGHFYFWKDNKQKHLYAVLNAIDTVAYNFHGDDDTKNVTGTAANDAAYAAKIAAKARRQYR